MSQRRFSLDEDFMKYDTDDLVYGFMRAISTAHPIGNGQYEEYLAIKTFQKERKVIQNICGTSAKTITNRLNKLIESGLVEVGEIEDKEKTIPCYFFPYDELGTYKLIDKEMVSYLVASRNAQAIRIYLYLLNCNSYKSDYVFTIREIKKALGYAETTKTCDKIIGYVLESFQKEGIIRIETEWQETFSDCGNSNKTERMILKFIATKKP
jgi:hypothetical protein